MAGAEHYLRDVVVPSVTAGAAAGRIPDLACWAVVSLDDDEKAARRRARQGLAFYFATPSYATVSERAPWREAVLAIRESFRANGADWDALADLVPDEMVDELTASGPPDAVAGQLQAMEARFAACGATEIVLQTVAAGMTEAEILDNCRRIVRECAPVK
jgi:alkanesulfonate monooxygenase SsuD/methylene tetrahydromethanopterin reductase-like flavin-dependent oxidoreductase (luciferase family)